MAVYYDPDTWHLLKQPVTALAVQVATVQAFVSTTKEQRKRYEGMQGDMFPELEEDFNARLELGKGMLEHYFQWAPTVDNFTPVKAEVEFEVPVFDPRFPPPRQPIQLFASGLPIVYQGRIDTIVQDPEGHYWNLEHKTTSKFGDTSHLDLDEQITSYGWALWSMGIVLKGAIYSEAYKAVPVPPQQLLHQREGRWYSVNKQQSTTYDLTVKTLTQAHEDLERYAEYLEYLRAQGNPYFRRFQQHRTTAEYQEVGARIGYEAIDMLQGPHIYANPGRFNCSFCRFREPCIALNKGLDYQFMLDNLYVKREEGTNNSKSHEVTED
jgi:hypothetical protein